MSFHVMIIHFLSLFHRTLKDLSDLEENIQDLKELLNFVENQPKLGDPC